MCVWEGGLYSGLKKTLPTLSVWKRKETVNHRVISLCTNGGKSGSSTSFTLIKVCGYTPIFSRQFCKGDNFHDVVFAYLEDEVFPEWGLLLKKRICSDGSKFFPLRDDPNLYGRQN